MGVSYTYSSDGTRLTKTVNGVKTSYTWDGAQLVSQTTTGGDTLYFLYHGSSRVGLEYKGNTYYYIYNLQGDVVGLVNSSGTSVVSYTYDAWGNPESISGSMASTLGAANPFRYRGYYYDTESGLYYLMSRYYDPVVGRFLNADGEISGDGDSTQGHNLFVYCFNNPINMCDSTGHWPKWLSGALNVVGGVIQAAAGSVLIAAAPVSGGASAILGSALFINGSLTVAAGVGQIVNDVTNSNVMHEENIIKTGAKAVGKAIGGSNGEAVAGAIYDVADSAATICAGAAGARAGTKALQQAGKIPVKVNINQVLNNPLDEFVTSGPAPGVISEYCRSIPLNGYGKIYATQLPNGFYQLANGHHRVAALKSLGKETIDIFLTK